MKWKYENANNILEWSLHADSYLFCMHILSVFKGAKWETSKWQIYYEEVWKSSQIFCVVFKDRNNSFGRLRFQMKYIYPLQVRAYTNPVNLLTDLSRRRPVIGDILTGSITCYCDLSSQLECQFMNEALKVQTF